MTERQKLIWLVPILASIHNLEEAMSIPAFLQGADSAFPKFITEAFSTLTRSQLLSALLIVTVIPYILAFLAWSEPVPRWGFYLLCGFQAAMLINVFAHIAMAVAVRGYAPGVVTAMLINLPFSVYLFYKASVEHWLNRNKLMLVGAIGILLHLVGLPALLILAGGVS